MLGDLKRGNLRGFAVFSCPTDHLFGPFIAWRPQKGESSWFFLAADHLFGPFIAWRPQKGESSWFFLAADHLFGQFDAGRPIFDETRVFVKKHVFSCFLGPST